MGAALRIILIIVIVWYVVRVIERVIGPALFGTSNKVKDSRKSTRQGDVTITDNRKGSKDKNPEKDDYVDYEEVD
ncbi:MAG TPA: hypothetical protein ENI20_02230 [Bacteroides sp.]|nr:hypothetical protein [Bacteroides sp.]